MVYGQTTPTQDDIDGDGMRNNNDQNDDNDGKADFLDDDDDNDNIADSVDPILNTPEQQASPPPTTTTTTPPPTTPPQQQQQLQTLTPSTTDPELQKFNQIVYNCQTVVQKMYPNAQTANDVFMKSPAAGTTPGDWSQITQCNQLLGQGIVQYCNNLQTYDATRCTHVNTPQITNLIGMISMIAEQASLLGPGSIFGGLLGSK